MHAQNIEVKPDNELFRFMYAEWNITSLLEQIYKRKLPAITITVDKLAGQNNMINIDQVYALKTDLKKPLVLIELQEDKYFLVDGHHRLYKAVKNGVEVLLAHHVPFTMHIKCVTDKGMVRKLKKLYKQKNLS